MSIAIGDPVIVDPDSALDPWIINQGLDKLTFGIDNDLV
jgi:hypothetical protein